MISRVAPIYGRKFAKFIRSDEFIMLYGRLKLYYYNI